MLNMNLWVGFMSIHCASLLLFCSLIIFIIKIRGKEGVKWSNRVLEAAGKKWQDIKKIKVINFFPWETMPTRSFFHFFMFITYD